LFFFNKIFFISWKKVYTINIKVSFRAKYDGIICVSTEKS